MASSKALIASLVLALVASSTAAGGRSLQQANLLNRAEDILGGAVSDVRSSLHHIVDGLLGEGNRFATSLPTNIDSLSWSSLQNLDIAQPVEDFVGSIRNKTLVKDILEAEDKVTDFIDQFCEEASFTESEMIPSNCVGKQLIVRLAPWECLLFDNKTVSCTPAYIEVIKNPAVCTAKYNSSATFTGKECKLQKMIGDELTKVIGGDAFSVDINKNLLDLPRELPSALLPGQFDTTAPVSTGASASASASVFSNGAAAGAFATAGRR